MAMFTNLQFIARQEYETTAALKMCITAKAWLKAWGPDKPARKSDCPLSVRTNPGCTFSLGPRTMMYAQSTSNKVIQNAFSAGVSYTHLVPQAISCYITS